MPILFPEFLHTLHYNLEECIAISEKNIDTIEKLKSILVANDFSRKDFSFQKRLSQ